jgi:hypothetical protein
MGDPMDVADDHKIVFLLLSGNWHQWLVMGSNHWAHNDDPYWVYELGKAYRIELGLEKLRS